MGTVPNSRLREHEYYSLVKEALEGQFRNSGYCIDFEVTGWPPKRSIPERFLRKNGTLKKHKRVLPTPDVMGLVWKRGNQNKKLVIAEFKPSPRFRSLFQAKGYDELFNSDYTFLVGAQPISESSRSTVDYVRNNTGLLETKRGWGKIYIYFLHKTAEGAITLARLGSEIDLPDVSMELLKDE